MKSEREARAGRVLDCIGLFCPVPVLKTREEIDKMVVGEVLVVLADDPAAEDDLRSWAGRTGHRILEIKKEPSHISVSIQKTK
jgi:tRNA 2-thiouridine synthesizing protein A